MTSQHPPTMLRRRTVLLGLAATLGLAGSAVAAAPSHGATAPHPAKAALTSDAAMRKGIRDYARVVRKGTASRIRVDCVPATKVGSTKPCRGSFVVTRKGRISHYRLVSGKAQTFRNTPGSIEYHMFARTNDPLPGARRSTGSLAGFLQ